MKIIISDSGLGGLSVCAELESRLMNLPLLEDIHIVYANAAPEDTYGYNNMPTRTEKIETFDRFLRNTQALAQADLVYVACNTLSVLIPSTPYSRTSRIPIQGIIDTGTREMLDIVAENALAGLLIFATPTTIAENIYQSSLISAGIADSQIVGQACPGLAHAISNDDGGPRVTAMIRGFVREALNQLDIEAEKVTAFLGCTHFGYQSNTFEKAFTGLGVSVNLLNPNSAATREILSQIPQDQDGQGRISVEFWSRYAIPRNEISTLVGYLKSSAPLTLQALEGHQVLPDLF